MQPICPVNDEELNLRAHSRLLPRSRSRGSRSSKRARCCRRRCGLGLDVASVSGRRGVGTLAWWMTTPSSLSKSQRQIIHATRTVGKAKVESAVAALAEGEPACARRAHPMRLDADNVDAPGRGPMEYRRRRFR